jgi:hypothetical protein
LILHYITDINAFKQYESEIFINPLLLGAGMCFSQSFARECHLILNIERAEEREACSASVLYELVHAHRLIE